MAKETEDKPLTIPEAMADVLMLLSMLSVHCDPATNSWSVCLPNGATLVFVRAGNEKRVQALFEGLSNYIEEEGTETEEQMAGLRRVLSNPLDSSKWPEKAE